MNRRQILLGAGGVAIAGGLAWEAMAGMGSAADYAAATARVRAALPDQAQIQEMVRYATLAPNGHNTQPWVFKTLGNVIRILPDLARRTPVVDPDDHHVFVGLGAAAETLALAAAAGGRPGDLTFDPVGDAISFHHEAGQPRPSVLFEAIPRRQSTRADYDGRPVSASDLRNLAAAGSVPGVDLVLLTDRPRLERLSELVVAGNAAQMAEPAFRRELKSWLRFNPRQALGTGDGLYSVASGVPATPDWLGKLGFDWLMTTRSDNEKYTRQIRTSAGIAVFVGALEDHAHWVEVGRACQRFALQATALGLKCAFINQPVEVARLRPELAALVGLKDRRPDIVMRFGHGPTLPYSLRRPLDAVMAT